MPKTAGVNVKKASKIVTQKRHNGENNDVACT